MKCPIVGSQLLLPNPHLQHKCISELSDLPWAFICCGHHLNSDGREQRRDRLQAHGLSLPALTQGDGGRLCSYLKTKPECLGPCIRNAILAIQEKQNTTPNTESFISSSQRLFKCTAEILLGLTHLVTLSVRALPCLTALLQMKVKVLLFLKKYFKWNFDPLPLAGVKGPGEICQK